MKTLGAKLIQIHDQNTYEYRIKMDGLKNEVVFYRFGNGEIDTDNLPDISDLWEVIIKLNREFGSFVEKNEDDEYRSDIYELEKFNPPVSYYHCERVVGIDDFENINIIKNLIRLNRIEKTGKYFNEFGGLKYE
jgi:hypothetical protein